MKIYCVPIIALGLASGFFSCGSTPDKSAPAGRGSAAPAETGFHLVNTEQSVLLVPARGVKSPRMDIDLSLLEVTGADRDVEFFNNLLYSTSPERYADAVIEENKNKYLASRELAEPRDQLPANASWEYIEKTDFERLGERGMVIEREKYVYSGGANGEGTKEYFVIDLAEPKVLASEDFFRDVDDPRLKDLVASELRRYSAARGVPVAEGDPADAETSVFFNAAPEPSRDFFISGEGMGMHWNPAEIAPHSAGDIDIVIPWRALSPLLKHETMELMTEFGIYLFM